MAKIMIIDDSQSLRLLLREALESNQHNVIEFSSGIEALEFFKDHLKSEESTNSKLDLIFCDQNMPQIDGITFCKRFQEGFGFLKIPIIMLSTETNPELKRKAKEYGVKGWIMKPFEKTVLLKGIEMLLKSKDTGS